MLVYPLRNPRRRWRRRRVVRLASSSRGVYFRRAVYAVFTIIYSQYYNGMLRVARAQYAII